MRVIFHDAAASFRGQGAGPTAEQIGAKVYYRIR